MIRPLLLLALSVSFASFADAAPCVNKYVASKDPQKVTFTLLTGTLTFDEAKELAAAIASGSAEPLAWMGSDGKVIARQFGALRVVRPMPVACDEKPSGVVLQVVFPTFTAPGSVVPIRFDRGRTVEFLEQKN